MTGRTFNALSSCTENSARSRVAESLLNKWGDGNFHAYTTDSCVSADAYVAAAVA